MYRSTELFFAILFTFLMFTLLLLVPDMKPTNLLPVMEEGVLPVLKGSIPFLSSCTLPLIVLNMVYPVCFENVKEAKKALFKGYFLGAATNFVTVTACVLVIGSDLVANTRFPMHFVNKEIDTLIILTRLEAITFSIWTVVRFIAAFSYTYAGILGLAQLLKIKNYKIFVLPMGLLLSLFSTSIYKSAAYQIDWDSKTWPPLSFTLGFILPVVLLILSFIRRNKSKNSS